MDLILWRHAEADEADHADEGDGQREDLHRALTHKGERQAERMAGWLRRQLASTTRVLVSPARRTQQTAQRLERKFKTLDAVAPGGTVEALLQAARWPDSREPVLVVGHQPTLGVTASYLLSGATTAWALRKGGVLWLRGREREGQIQVVLHAALTPDMV